MSQFGQRVAMWTIVILLLMIGVFLQIRSARGQTPSDPLAAPGKLSITIAIGRF
jgi:hypothetical protein